MAVRRATARVEPKSGAISGDVIEELRRRYDRLTQSQKRIAEYIVEHTEAVAFSTVDQLASALDVNPSTIVRFTYRLGLNGFPDLQERMRQLVRGALSRTGDPVSESRIAVQLEGTSFGASLSRDWQNLHHTIAGLDSEAMARAIDAIAKANRVYVVAGFSTFPVAHYFSLILDRLRPQVTLLSSNDVLGAGRVVDMSSEDCLVALTFPRYATATHRIVLWAKENKAKTVAITDSPISAVGQIAEIVLLAASGGAGMHNSYVAPLAVANALLNGVAAAGGPAAIERYSRRERMMNRWDAFLLKIDGEDDEPRRPR